MGEEFELKNVFIGCNDRTYTPIEKVEEVKLSDDIDVVYDQQWSCIFNKHGTIKRKYSKT